MPEFKATYDSLDDIPESVEDFRSLFVEKGGKFELSGIDGMKTSADVERVQLTLSKEREQHNVTKGKLNVWGDLSHDEVVKSLDRIPELEAAAEGKLDEDQLEQMATKRADGIIKTKVAPLQRDIQNLTKERDELTTVNQRLTSDSHTRERNDLLRPMLAKANVMAEHHEDVEMYAERHFERTEDGQYFTREGIHEVTPGATMGDWLTELIERRPGWLPPSQGSGARGSGGGGGLGGKNPWSSENWSLTEQGNVVRVQGEEKAQKMAEAAGSKIGATRPTPKS